MENLQARSIVIIISIEARRRVLQRQHIEYDFCFQDHVHQHMLEIINIGAAALFV
jgi:hypothetical protein